MNDITPTLAAAVLGVSRQTTYNMISTGKLRTVRTSEGKQYVNPDDIDAELGTPGTLRRCGEVLNAIEQAKQKAVHCKDFHAIARLSGAAGHLRHFAVVRNDWHESVLRVYDIVASCADEYDSLIPCLDILKSLLDRAHNPH
jgi:excisionase family DNA binding protein